MAAVPLSVCISGALGNVGRRLVEGVRDDPGFTLHSAVARREVGRDVGRRWAARRSGSSSPTTSRWRSRPGPTC